MVDERYKDIISRDLITCPICNKKMWVYVFKDGSYRTIHKHNEEEYIPPNYIPENIAQEENLE